jgi:glutaredoxin
MEKKLELYGTNWCMKSAKLRNYLQFEWIEFDDFNVEEDKEAELRVRALYDGELKFPTLKYGDEFLKNPSIRELSDFLEVHHLKE